MLFCLHLKTGGAKRITEFESEKAKMSQEIYPNVAVIKFRLMKDLDA